MPAVLFLALSAGVSMAVYSIFLRLASASIHPALGAAVITGTAFLVNLVVLLVVKSYLATGPSLAARDGPVAPRRH
jgi:formate/nitrite transporter FocA (FNT family)